MQQINQMCPFAHPLLILTVCTPSKKDIDSAQVCHPAYLPPVEFRQFSITSGCLFLTTTHLEALMLALFR